MSELRTKLRTWAFDRGALLALVVLVVYCMLAPTTVVDGDNAEFATLGATGGRAHPSGYPAYVLYLRLTSWLPGSTPAHTAAIATCLLAALTVFALHAACRAWGARPLAATIACAMYAASPIVLRMHTEAEVFAGNALVVATVLWLAATAGALRGMWRGAVLGLVAGLGAANHLTCTIVAPIGVIGVVRAIREAPNKPVAAVAAVVGLVVGLSAYGYLLIAEGPASYGTVDGFGDIVRFFLREDYGGPLGFTVSQQEVNPMDNVVALGASLGRAWLWVPALLGLAALVHRSIRPKGESRASWVLLALCFLIAGPLIVLRFNVAPEGIGLYVCQRFHLLAILLLAIPVAIGIDEVGTRVGAKFPSKLGRPGVVTGLALLGFLALVATSLSWLRAVHSPALERYIENALAAVPENAIVVVRSEDVYFGSEYVQHARGVRSDVTIFHWALISHPWYRERVERRGIPIVAGYTPDMSVAQAERLLATGRPLFVDTTQKEALVKLPGYPYGAWFRVLPAGEKPPKLGEVFELNKQLLARFDLDYPHPSPDDQFAALAHQRYAVIWRTLAGAARAAGNEEAAQYALRTAAYLDPR